VFYLSMSHLRFIKLLRKMSESMWEDENNIKVRKERGEDEIG